MHKQQEILLAVMAPIEAAVTSTNNFFSSLYDKWSIIRAAISISQKEERLKQYSSQK
jgi:hypothetical protein